MELNTLMQKEMSEKDETIRILENKNEALRQTLDARVDELEVLKQKVTMLEEEVCNEVVCTQVTLSLLCSYRPRQLRKKSYWMRRESCWQTLLSMVGCAREGSRVPLLTYGVNATLKWKEGTS